VPRISRKFWRARLLRILRRQKLRKMKLAARVAAVIGVVAACVWFLRSVEWHSVGDALRGADLRLVLLAAALNFLLVLVKAERWRVICEPIAALSTARLFANLLVGYAASIVLPGRAGEALRVVLLRDRVAVLTAAGTIVAEKLFEGLGLLLLILPLPFLLPLPRWVALTIAGVAALGFLGSIGAVSLARVGNRWSRGLACVRSRDRFVAATGWSLLSHLIDALEVWLVLSALHLDLPWPAPLLVLLTLNLAIAAPSTPGQLGAFEAGAVAGLRVLHVESSAALAFALVYHLAQVLPVLAAGLLLSPRAGAPAAAATAASFSPARPDGRGR
jgi:uncharacterized membrane protein YbhN (UPF0104 family)